MIESTQAGASAPATYAPGWVPAVLTPRGTAAARLSEFEDAWAELTLADRQWFAEWLAELLVDACEGEQAWMQRRPGPQPTGAPMGGGD